MAERCGLRLAKPFTPRTLSLHGGFAPLVSEGVTRARARRQPVLVSWTTPVPPVDPLDFFARGRPLSGERLLWGVPSRDQFVVGIGEAHSLTGSGTERFSAIASAWRLLL